MPEYDFSHVDAVVIEPQLNTMRVLRDMLSRLGIKKVETFDSVTSAQPLLTGGNVDLLLVDCDGAHEADAFRFIRTYRNEPATPNPYAAIIVTTWQPTPVQVMRMTNSGADDMLVKPVSPKQVMDRLTVLIESRRKFVVTSDYIGPDRRKSPREGAQVPLIEAPNLLRLKATGAFGTINLRELMADANRAVGEQKRLRASIQVGFLVEFAVPGLTASPPERMAVEHLSRVPGVVDDLHRRLPGSRVQAAAETACRAVKVLSERIRAQADAGAVSADELAQLRTLARDLAQAVDPARAPESIVKEVQVAVAAYRTRLEAMAQAKAEAAAKPQADAAKDAPKDAGAPSAARP